MTITQPRVALRAGHLTLDYDAGSLRYLRFGDQEVLRQIYAAVRDHDWATVIGVLHDEQIERHADHFRITYTATHQQGDVDFTWRGEIVGTADSTITFTFDGVANSSFKRNRVGFCVLHPLTLAGSACEIEHADGTRTQGQFPDHIAPHQPYLEIRAVTHPVNIDGATVARAEVRMEGDIFEMEDQRNWSDASYKTYCTPQRLPMPVLVEAGTRIQQQITVRLVPNPPNTADTAALPDTAARADVLTFNPATPARPIPPIGLGLASALTAADLDRLQPLNLAHLRLECDITAPDAVQRLQHAQQDAAALGAQLELALHVDADASALDAILPTLNAIKGDLVRVLVLGAGAAAARQALAGLGVAIGAGTSDSFVDLNRNRPHVEGLAWLAYGVTPQVHAFDNATMTETLAAQTQQVRTARTFAGDAKIAVTPITLKPRPAEDARLHAAYGASWTLGSIKALVEADSVTYFEATGACGILSAEATAAPHPVYAAFAGLGAFAGGTLRAGQSNDALRIDGFITQKDGHSALWLMNYTPHPVTVTVDGIGNAWTLTGGTDAVITGTDPALQVTLPAEGFAQLTPHNPIA